MKREILITRIKLFFVSGTFLFIIQCASAQNHFFGDQYSADSSTMHIVIYILRDYDHIYMKIG